MFYRTATCPDHDKTPPQYLHKPEAGSSLTAVYVVWTLYAATYFTANTSDTLIERYLDPDKTPIGKLVPFAVFAVNIPLSVWKDVRFAQFFGNRLDAGPRSTVSAAVACVTGPRNMPISVSAAFLARDIITVFGSFAIDPYVSAVIPDSLAQTAHAKASASQLIVPAITQIVAPPAHLLGLDLYNGLSASGLLDRIGKARLNLLSTTIVRAFRLIPAYGIRIIFNTRLRPSLRSDAYDSYHLETTLV
ncbi:putative Mitochondrial fission process protein 1 [Seiridium unicorne]|uniref:Mitochondrial fission process protein 1 n=1 Tax=Seiridium unicorne TaxID=138068 RepID=A0ABR2VBB7_9PEZI